MKTREERIADCVKHYEGFGQSFQYMVDLDAEFPEVDMFGPQSVSAEVGPGWVEILRPALRAIRDFGGKVGQIKQKFGGLRLYWDPPQWIVDEYQAWFAAGAIGPDPYTLSAEYRATDEAVQLAQELSFKVCDQCAAAIESDGPDCRHLR